MLVSKSANPNPLMRVFLFPVCFFTGLFIPSSNSFSQSTIANENTDQPNYLLIDDGTFTCKLSRARTEIVPIETTGEGGGSAANPNGSLSAETERKIRVLIKEASQIRIRHTGPKEGYSALQLRLELFLKGSESPLYLNAESSWDQNYFANESNFFEHFQTAFQVLGVIFSPEVQDIEGEFTAKARAKIVIQLKDIPVKFRFPLSCTEDKKARLKIEKISVRRLRCSADVNNPVILGKVGAVHGADALLLSSKVTFEFGVWGLENRRFRRLHEPPYHAMRNSRFPVSIEVTPKGKKVRNLFLAFENSADFQNDVDGFSLESTSPDDEFYSKLVVGFKNRKIVDKDSELTYYLEAKGERSDPLEGAAPLKCEILK